MELHGDDPRIWSNLRYATLTYWILDSLLLFSSDTLDILLRFPFSSQSSKGQVKVTSWFEICRLGNLPDLSEILTSALWIKPNKPAEMSSSQNIIADLHTSLRDAPPLSASAWNHLQHSMGFKYRCFITVISLSWRLIILSLITRNRLNSRQV